MTTEPKFIPYGTNPQLDKLVDTFSLRDWLDDDEKSILVTLAQNGYALDKLADCKCKKIRKIVAKWGYCTEKFLNDDCAKVQVEAINLFCAKLRKENNISLPPQILQKLFSQDRNSNGKGQKDKKGKGSGDDGGFAAGLAMGMLF